MELIVIDDGSTDQSISLIKKCIDNISNVKLFTINHSGISIARNFGIKKTIGQYIMFIDGDDFIIDNTLFKIINYIKTKDFELLMFNLFKFYEDENYYEKEILNINNTSNLTTNDLIYNKICGRPWRFIYNKKLIIDNKLHFPEKLIYEDEEWVPKVIYYARTIEFINEYIYVYRKRKGSITTVKNIKSLTDLMSIIERTYKWSLNCNRKKEYIYFSLTSCIRNILGSLLYLKSKEEKKMVSIWYKKNIAIILDILSNNKKLKFLINLFGEYFGIKIYKKFFREKYLLRKEKVFNINDSINVGGK